MKNQTTEYLDAAVVAVEKTNLSPMHYSSRDEYIDAVSDESSSIIGPPNAAQKSTVEKWAREDWDLYYKNDD